MSVTVYVDGWDDVEYTMVKAYMDDLYPGLDAECFEQDIERKTHFLEEDTGRVYEMRRQYCEEYPEVNMANSNFSQVLSLLGMGHLDMVCDSLSGERLDRFYKALLKAQNGSAKSQEEDHLIHEGNFHTFIPGNNYYTMRLGELLELLRFARQKGVGIYWA